MKAPAPHSMRILLDSAQDAFFSLILPQTKCAACAARARIGYGICEDCLARLNALRLTENLCPICGLPGAVFPCPDCSYKRDEAGAGFEPPQPAFARARGAYLYSDVARTLIHISKFGGQPRIAARAFAPAMVGCLRETMPGADCLVPVPLSRGKMIERGYNQSAFLAARMRALAGIPLRESLLYRTRDTAQQAGLDRDARIANVKGAFSAAKAAKHLRIALIDDVITTSNTASACAEALLCAGAREVCVIAAARAGRQEDVRT